MTNKEINERIQTCRTAIATEEGTIKVLHQMLKDNSPIQVGDRVRITTPAHKPYGWSQTWIAESIKEAECTELEIDTWRGDEERVRVIYHPITAKGVVAKVGKFTTGDNDKVEKI